MPTFRNGTVRVDWEVRDDGRLKIAVGLSDLYCAMVARFNAGDVETAVKYSRWFLCHPDLRCRHREWIANAVAISRVKC